MDEEKLLVRRHLLIAGTGRAGTSFLVRYLAELGLDTHLGRHGDSSRWDEDANAGLEDAPFLTPDSDLPYVIKCPWLYHFIDDVLADPTFAPDAVIIPVRDLAEAVTSRCVVQQRAIHQSAPWLSRFDRTWEDWTHVPGGIIYSLNPVDQGRLLAVGFHHLVQRLVAADVPTIFLSFPRLTDDATYLFEKLRPILPQTIDSKIACSAHERVVDPAKIRVGTEIGSVATPNKLHSTKVVGYELHAAHDLIALRRELVRVRGQLADETHHLTSKIAALEAALSEAAAAAKQARHDKDDADDARREEARRYHQEVEELTQEISRLRQQMTAALHQTSELETELANILASRSWRLTLPYRALGSGLANVFRKASRKACRPQED